MIIVALADIHGHVEILKSAGEVLKTADIVLLAGDITNFGGTDAMSSIIDTIRRYNTNILAVAGNCDSPEAAKYLKDQKISLDGKIVERHGAIFTGIDGTENSSMGFVGKMKDISQNIPDGKPTVFVSHQPAQGTNVAAGGGGSYSIREFIMQKMPLLAISGHIHHARITDNLVATALANPGPASKGYYVHAEIDQGQLKQCQILNFLKI